MSYFPRKRKPMTIVSEYKVSDTLNFFCNFPQENVSSNVHETTTFFDRKHAFRGYEACFVVVVFDIYIFNLCLILKAREKRTNHHVVGFLGECSSVLSVLALGPSCLIGVY